MGDRQDTPNAVKPSEVAPVFRVDAALAPLGKPRKHANGWVDLDGVFTRSGVFVYQNPDGTKRREYRPPEEVFDSESLASFAAVPVTDSHPEALLTAENARDYTRGTVIGVPVRDGDFMRGSLRLVDAPTIAKAEGGKRALSLGYTCDLDPTPGIAPNGERYDAIQRRIRGNHLAIVDFGRAGPEARLRMDGICLDTEQKGFDTVEKIRLDGADFEVDPKIARELEKRQAALQAAQGRLDALQATLDAERAQVTPAKIQEAVKARISLERQAATVLTGQDLAGKSDREIKAAVVCALAPSLKSRIDSASDDYLGASYDALLAANASNPPAVNKPIVAEQTTSEIPRADSLGGVNKARAAFMAKQQELSR